MAACKCPIDDMTDIIAYIPCYEGGNSVSAIKKDGQNVLIYKSIKSVINMLLKESSINVRFFKKSFPEIFGGTNLVPLPLGPGKVFLPVKVRKIIAINDGSFAYIDLSYIKEVVKDKETVIKFKGGSDLICLESVKTVRYRMKTAILMEDKLYSRLIRDCGLREGLPHICSDYDKAVTKSNITLLAYEIMALRGKINNS